MGSACGGSNDDKTNVTMGVGNAKWSGRAETFVCPAPYAKAIKLWRYDKATDFFPPGAVTKFECNGGNNVGATRKITLGNGVYIEEVCTFWQPNAHGYIVTVGGEPGNPTEMIAEKGNFHIVKDPDNPDRCFVSVTVNYQTSNKDNARANIDTKF